MFPNIFGLEILAFLFIVYDFNRLWSITRYTYGLSLLFYDITSSHSYKFYDFLEKCSTMLKKYTYMDQKKKIQLGLLI